MYKRHFPGFPALPVMMAVLSLFVFGAEEYMSQWNSQKMSVDGWDFEWYGVPTAMENKVQVDYAFKNDANLLHVLFKFKDPRQFMSSIMFTGMTVYIDVNGKKKKDYAINFRKKMMTADQFIAQLEADKGQLAQEEKDKIRGNEFYVDHVIQVTNKKAAGEAKSDPGQKIPAIFRSNQGQDGSLVWEFAVPMERAADFSAGVGATPGQQIKVGFEWGGPTEEWKKAQAARIGDQEAQARAAQIGAVGTERGGARGELDRNIGLSRMRRQMPKKYNFWVDVKLAEKK
jgi:hypothetical protein